MQFGVSGLLSMFGCHPEEKYCLASTPQYCCQTLTWELTEKPDGMVITKNGLCEPEWCFLLHAVLIMDCTL